MAHLAQAPERQARFVEEKRLAALAAPVRSEGWLGYRPPAHLEKITTAPQPENLVVDGDRLVINNAASDAPQVVELSAQPAIRTLVDTVRGALSGNLALLQRIYSVSGTGTPADWQIVLRPHDPEVARLVQQVQLAGGAALRSIQTTAANGDTDTLTIKPAP